MNDITALALLVSKAKASVFTMEYISQFEAANLIRAAYAMTDEEYVASREAAK